MLNLDQSENGRIPSRVECMLDNDRHWQYYVIGLHLKMSCPSILGYVVFDLASSGLC